MAVCRRFEYYLKTPYVCNCVIDFDKMVGRLCIMTRTPKPTGHKKMKFKKSKMADVDGHLENGKILYRSKRLPNCDNILHGINLTHYLSGFFMDAILKTIIERVPQMLDRFQRNFENH